MSKDSTALGTAVSGSPATVQALRRSSQTGSGVQGTQGKQRLSSKGSSAGLELALSMVPGKENKKVLGRRASDATGTAIASTGSAYAKSGPKTGSVAKLGATAKAPGSGYSFGGDGHRIDWRRGGTGPLGAGNLQRRHTYSEGNRLGSSIGSGEEKNSPRLWYAGQFEEHGAPLVAEAPRHDEPEERFCVTGVISDCHGPSRRHGLPTPTARAPYPDIVARLEAGIRQASLVLSDRFTMVQQKWQLCMLVTGPCFTELCEIADGLSTAAYHMQKWAALLGDGKLPTKPMRCSDSSGAFATFHCALPRFMVNAKDVTRGLNAAITEYGPQAELHVEGLGIPTADIQALVPHLEHIVGRANRLLPKLRPTAYRDFLLNYFGPTIGRGNAQRLLPFLGLDLSLRPL
eukprot:gnl/TRDRNA2_/TRDRNA2_194001_c0_seq1.p1 gnl/TRDRNA2_/TRDRNA2_194001_c0~~gnl/TRDRNA2_/TRDRNA2_194001_c0_seq1.p1  ORF type:complete len:403 (+),score=51.90 gnl/TRDRNA2_/TRDRNA2_194001_c0_seq1:94-1302(+)